MSMKDTMKIIQLEGEIQTLHTECTQRLNHLCAVQVMLQSDEIDEALEYLNELLPEE